MKKIVLLLCGIVSFCMNMLAQNEAGLAADDIFYSEMLENEAKAQSQKIQLPRTNKEKPLNVKFILENLMNISDLEIEKMSVIKSSMEGESVSCIENIDEILAFDLLPKLSVEENVSVTIKTKGDGNAIILFSRIIGGKRDDFCYVRVSMMLPNVSSSDDLRSFHTEYEPTRLSFVVAYNFTDPTSRLVKFYEVYESLKTKLEEAKYDEISDEEKTILNGLDEFKDMGYYLGYAEWLFEQKRYYDAYITYARVLNNINAYCLKEDEKPVYFNACYNIAKCLVVMRQYDEAFYYMKLANVGGNVPYSEVNDIYEKVKQRNINLLNTSKTNEPTLAFVLDQLFGVGQNDVSMLQLVDLQSGKSKQIASKEDIAKTKISEICGNSIALSMKFSKAYYETNNEDDQSILCNANSILMYVYKIPKADTICYRVCTMIPNFRGDDDKHIQNNQYNEPLGISFVVFPHGSASIIGMKDNKAIVKLEELYNSRDFLQLMYESELFYGSIIKRGKVKSEIVKDCNFYIGASMLEYSRVRNAFNYLGASMPSKVMSHVEEYINCITACKDYRSLAEISKYENVELDGGEKVKDKYNQFIKRRKAFVLIDMEEWEEAENLLNELKNYPESQRFAEGELNYIKEMRRLSK